MYWLRLDGWAGITKYPVKIVSETPTKYRVELLQDCRLPGRNKHGKAGQVVLVPKYAITDTPPTKEQS